MKTGALKNRPARGQKKLARVVAVCLAAAAFSFLSQHAQAQRYTVAAEPDSPSGQLIELINLEMDEARKLALLDQFVQNFPQHEGIAWAYEQMQNSALEAGQFDKALTVGEKLVQLHPDDLEAAQLNVKAAESKGDKTSAKLWSDYVLRVAQRILESPPPKDPEQLEEWKRLTGIASQYSAQDEYALFKKALDSGDPRQKIKLLDDLLRRNPDSPYLSQAHVIYLNSYRALGDKKNSLLYAERILKADSNNEDALLTTAEAYLQGGSSADKVLAYSTRIIDVMKKKKKPAIVREEDWEKKKTLYIGTAYWMMGNTFINQNRFGQAEASLRAALPLLRKNDQSAASILFYLGWSNYKLGNFVEAVRFYKQCSVIRSQFQEPALKNIGVIREQQGVE